MKRFVDRGDRWQSTLLPECLDDWIDGNNPVRCKARTGKAQTMKRADTSISNAVPARMRTKLLAILFVLPGGG